MVGDELPQDLHQVVGNDAGRPRAIDRRHDVLIQHIDVEVHPEALIRHQIERPSDTADDSGGTYFCCFENVDPIDLGFVYVRPREVGIPVLALAQLNNVAIRNERSAKPWPLCHQRLASPGRHGEVHSRCSAQALLGIIVSGMAKVAVSINVYQRERTCLTCTCKRTEKD